MNNYEDYMPNQYPEMMEYEPMQYPEVYYMVNPMVEQRLDMMDQSYNAAMYPYPSPEMVDKMSEDIYKECMEKYPEKMKEYENQMPNNETNQRYRRRRGLFGNLIPILLIRNLLRRRRYGYGRGYGYGYGPGYGLGLGYGPGYGGYGGYGPYGY